MDPAVVKSTSELLTGMAPFFEIPKPIIPIVLV